MHVSGPKGEQAVIPGTDDGIPWVTSQYRFIVAVTPHLTNSLPSGSCDAIMVSQDATVTCVGSDDAAATPVALPLITGRIHELGLIRVTAVSAGTAYALYHRKPGS